MLTRSTLSVIGLQCGLLAAALSWTVNQSFLWSIIHGVFCGWFYVIYYLLVHYNGG